MGNKILVIVNHASGSNADETIYAQIEEILRNAGCEPSLLNIAETSIKQMNLAVADSDIVIAVGGDGTVNSVAQLCALHDVTMGVVPRGTFNYFARMHLIPTALEEALQVIIAGHTTAAAAGYLNERIFLNNASFGLYYNLIENREADTKRFGRNRVIAFFSAVYTLFGQSSLITLRMQKDNQWLDRRVTMLFVGNNPLQLANVGLEQAAESAIRRLAMVVVKPLSRWGVVTLILHGVTRTLTRSDLIEEESAEILELHTRRRKIKAIIDGEKISLHSPVQLRVDNHALKLLVPAPQTEGGIS